jgi:hypothetical protein
MALTKTQIAMIEASGTAGSGNFLRGDGAWSNVGVSQLSATGTPSSSTFLRGDGTWNAPPASITAMTAQATTSGTFKDFTGIPAGVERITVMLNGVSTNSTSLGIVQLGTSGGIQTSGYLGRTNDVSTGTIAYSTGFNLSSDNAAANVYYGTITLTLLTPNNWTVTGILSRTDGNNQYRMAGGVTLGSVLDRVRITTVNGTDAFDAGSINILYEF